MSGKKGYEATKRLRHRCGDRRGGNAAHDWPTGELAGLMLRYFQWLETRNHPATTIEGRRHALRSFLQWSLERDLSTPAGFTRPILEAYQRHLWRYRKADDKPLGIRTQRDRLSILKHFFAWLCRENLIPANPAADLEPPRPEKRLPVEPLSIEQINALLNVPDVTDPLGIRDRAILEVFYGCGLRRTELTRLVLADYNPERATLYVRLGKGRKDRVVPVGRRATDWIAKYLDRVRPLLALSASEDTLFLTSYGEPFNPPVIGRKVAAWIKEAGIGRTGSCHLLRHSCATHMLEGGADIRFIQQLLGHEKLETTAIYTQVSIEQLKAVHSKTHPAETGKNRSSL